MKIYGINKRPIHGTRISCLINGEVYSMTHPYPGRLFIMGVTNKGNHTATDIATGQVAFVDSGYLFDPNHIDGYFKVEE